MVIPVYFLLPDFFYYLLLGMSAIYRCPQSVASSFVVIQSQCWQRVGVLLSRSPRAIRYVSMKFSKNTVLRLRCGSTSVNPRSSISFRTDMIIAQNFVKVNGGYGYPEDAGIQDAQKTPVLKVVFFLISFLSRFSCIIACLST